MKTRSIVQSLLTWFARNARDLPWRRTRDPYAVWVSEIMLQQTRVITVIPYWERWIRTLPNVAALAKARPALLHKLWEGLGYYSRVRNLQRAAQNIVEQHEGRFPREFEQVLALPGIGRYTAGAICSIAFNQPRAIVDGNVVRVLTRLYGITGNPRTQRTNSRLWKLAEELVLQAADLRRPRGAAGACAQFNQALMELGAVVCTPRQPRCGTCPVVKHCVAHRQDRVHLLPALSPRTRATPRRFVAFVARKGDRLLVRQRPAGSLNAHLWDFPNLELLANDGDLKQAARLSLGIRLGRVEPLLTVKHSITRYRITLEAYRIADANAAQIPAGKGQWLGRARLNRLAFTAAHKHIMRRLDTCQGKRSRGTSCVEGM